MFEGVILEERGEIFAEKVVRAFEGVEDASRHCQWRV